jgi:hypothetical protein
VAAVVTDSFNQEIKANLKRAVTIVAPLSKESVAVVFDILRKE